MGGIDTHAYYRKHDRYTQALRKQCLAVDGVTRNEVGWYCRWPTTRWSAETLFSLYGNYAYRIPLGMSTAIRLWDRSGNDAGRIDASRIDLDNPNDPVIANGRQSMFLRYAGMVFIIRPRDSFVG